MDFDPMAPTPGRLVVTLTLGEAMPAGKVLTIDIIGADTDAPDGRVLRGRHNTREAVILNVRPSTETGYGPEWTDEVIDTD